MRSATHRRLGAGSSRALLSGIRGPDGRYLRYLAELPPAVERLDQPNVPQGALLVLGGGHSAGDVEELDLPVPHGDRGLLVSITTFPRSTSPASRVTSG